jgi:hypothetical protein
MSYDFFWHMVRVGFFVSLAMLIFSCAGRQSGWGVGVDQGRGRGVVIDNHYEHGVGGQCE